MDKHNRKWIKQEARRNELREFLQEARHYFQTHREAVVLAAVLAVIVAGGGYIYMSYRRSVRAEALRLLNNGRGSLQSVMISYEGDRLGENGKNDLSKAVDDFIKLQNNGAGGEHLAGMAFFYLGNCRYYAHDYPAAIKSYRDYLARNPRSDFAGLARRNLGYCLKASGQLAEAAQEFQQLIEQKPWGVSAAECLAALVDLYGLLGQPQQAQAARDKLSVGWPGSYWLGCL